MNLQEIENRLRTLNPAAFQELGDLFLISKDRSYAAFIPTGSQFGKQKTTKGTPDTFIYTQNGESYMVEYSTNETLREKKLIEDIDKCIKEQDIDISKIKSIVLFTNFPLTKNEAYVIQKYAEDNHVQYTLYDGSRLSRELLVHHKDLIYHQLGIHVDTGQIVSVDTFIHEYDNAAGSIAAPLSNKFQYREKELLDIKTGLLENDLVLLHGAAGVGKTKLAIQAIREFCNENLSYKFYCVSYKGGDLLTDLICNVNLEYDNIIFVDDISEVDVAARGALLEHHPRFPERCNIEFAQVLQDGAIRMRVWERGSGITMACGTGACATAVAAALTGRSSRRSRVIMDGGTLDIEWRQQDGHVYLTGPATIVYEGDILLP